MPRTPTDPYPPGPLSPLSTPPYPPVTGAAVRASSPPGPTLAGIVHALKRRWALAAVLGGLAAAAAAAAAWAVVPAGQHSARAFVRLRPAGPDVVDRPPDEFEAFRKSQMFAVQSRDLIDRTLADPAVAALETVRTAADPARLIEDGLKVDAAPSPEVLAVTLAGDRPADLTAVLDALLKRYADEAVAAARRERDDRRKELERLAEGFRAEVAAADRQIRLVAEANGVLGPEAAEAKHARMQAELAKIEADLSAAQRERQDATDAVELLQQRARDRRSELAPAELAELADAHPTVAPVAKQRAARADALARAREVSGGNDAVPRVQDLLAEVGRLDAQLAAARAGVRNQIEADRAAAAERALHARLAAARDRLEAADRAHDARLRWRDEFQKALTASARGAYDIQALQAEVRPQREYLAKVQGRLVQLDAGREVRPRVSVGGPAVAVPHGDLTRKGVTAAAGLAAFAGMLALVGLVEWRSRRVDGVEAVVAEAGLRVLGAVPAFPPRSRLKADADPGWRFALNEAVNSARTLLLHSARSQSMQVVMITSAAQGEGKTSLAGQLGTSMAASGMRTVIVDCDLRNPSVHALFDLPAAAGVGEVLCQEADAADAVQPTSVPNLWVIPAGRCSPRVVAALAQGHPLETLFNRLRGQFDFILVDTCPVLPVADALLVGQHVDGVVFAVMQDVSRLPEVIQASDRLAELNVPLLGAVVNGVRDGAAYHADRYSPAKPLPA